MPEWESLYFFVKRNVNPICLVCHAALGQFKASNLQRHFSPLHPNIEQEFPKGTDLRKKKLVALKSQAEKQVQFFQKFTKHSETVTLVSYQLAWNIARAKKPYNEGDFIKKCLIDAFEILAPGDDKLKRSVSDVQLSRHSVERRILDNTAVESQLHSDLQACEYFSVALDESCDIQDKPQLAIFARSLSNECMIEEELLDIVPLKDRTRGIDVKEAMITAFAKANLPIPKLTAIATDGAPAMIGFVNGLVGLCKADQTFPDFWNFHCIFHREQLVSKSLNLDNVMKPVMEIVLSRFFELLDAVKLFMEEKDKDYPVLSDLEYRLWIWHSQSTCCVTWTDPAG